jgi:hypothetical protein
MVDKDPDARLRVSGQDGLELLPDDVDPASTPDDLVLKAGRSNKRGPVIQPLGCLIVLSSSLGNQIETELGSTPC